MSDEIRLISEATSGIYKNSVGSQIAVIKIKNIILMTAKEMAKLYEVGRPTITRHLLKLFMTKKLNKKSVSSILSHQAEDGKLYETRYYNAEAIVVIGQNLKKIEVNNFQKWLADK
jgi:hypothetical protein